MRTCENCGRETESYPCDWCGHSQGHLEMEDVVRDFDVAQHLIQCLRSIWHEFNLLPPRNDAEVVEAAIEQLLDHADLCDWEVIWGDRFIKVKED